MNQKKTIHKTQPKQKTNPTNKKNNKWIATNLLTQILAMTEREYAMPRNDKGGNMQILAMTKKNAPHNDKKNIRNKKVLQ